MLGGGQAASVHFSNTPGARSHAPAFVGRRLCPLAHRPLSQFSSRAPVYPLPPRCQQKPAVLRFTPQPSPPPSLLRLRGSARDLPPVAEAGRRRNPAREWLEPGK